MIFDLLGIDKKLGIWICASIVSVSLLSTTIIWAKTYYDIRADAVAVVEVAKEKRDAVGKSFDEAEEATKGVLVDAGDVLKGFTPTKITDMMEEARDRSLCVFRPLTEENECGPIVFDNKDSCDKFLEWVVKTDPHKVNTYECRVIE